MAYSDTENNYIMASTPVVLQMMFFVSPALAHLQLEGTEGRS